MAGDQGNGVNTAVSGRVLVVDDNTEVVRLLQLMLERAGYEAVAAYSGPEALERLEEAGQPGSEAVGLVLLDIRMPYMDGLEVCRRIRSRPSGATIPVVMVTALTSLSDRMAAFEAGANDYVTKPFHQPELLARVRAFTRLQAAEAQQRQMERRMRFHAWLLGHVRDAIVGLGQAGQVIYWNQSAEMTFGWAADEMSGQPLDRLFPAQSDASLASLLARDEGVWQAVTRDGHPLWVHSRVSPLQEGGETTGALVVATNVTEQHQAEMALQQRNRELQALYNLASDLAQAVSVEEILTVAAEHVTSVLSAPGGGGAAVLLDEEGETFTHGAAQGTAQALWTEAQRTNPADDPLLRAMGTANGPVVLTGTEVQARGGVWGQTGAAGLVAVPVGQQPIGALIMLCESRQATLTANVSLLSTFAQQISVAVKNARLLEQMTWARARLRQLTGQVVQAQEEERRRIARELHDEVGQALTGLKLNLAVLEGALPDQATALHEHLADSRALTESMMEEIRELALELRPPALDDLGLVPALRGYVERFIKRTGLDVTSDLDESTGRLPERMETALYRIIQEAMANIVRHAAARHVQVILRTDGDEVYVCVADDGRGFDPAHRLEAAVAEGRMGLLGIQERVALLRGRVKITAAPGRGTRVETWLPRHQDAD